jgi:hypothetical protein
MRQQTILSLLLLGGLACSGSESLPTETRPEFTPMCVPPRANVTAGVPVTRVKNSNFSTKFTVKNNCTSTMALTFTTSRTGAVATVTAPSPTTKVLAPGTSVAVFVGYHTGSPGSGTVVLTATTDFGDTSWGELQVTVTN